MALIPRGAATAIGGALAAVAMLCASAAAGEPALLADAPGVEVVRRHCTICHSVSLVTQSRATREGWADIIRWMQETQGLWPLGPDEAVILDYLAANYPPQDNGRRAPLARALLPSRQAAGSR